MSNKLFLYIWEILEALNFQKHETGCINPLILFLSKIYVYAKARTETTKLSWNKEKEKKQKNKLICYINVNIKKKITVQSKLK